MPVLCSVLAMAPLSLLARLLKVAASLSAAAESTASVSLLGSPAPFWRASGAASRQQRRQSGNTGRRGEPSLMRRDTVGERWGVKMAGSARDCYTSPDRASAVASCVSEIRASGVSSRARTETILKKNNKYNMSPKFLIYPTMHVALKTQGLTVIFIHKK